MFVRNHFVFVFLLSSLFLNDLTNVNEHDPNELAYVFLRRRDQFLNLYSQYMYDRTRSEHVLQTNPNIQRYFDELTHRLGLQTSDLTLNSLLNRPIQRLEKYKTILQVKTKTIFSIEERKLFV